MRKAQSIKHSKLQVASAKQKIKEKERPKKNHKV